MNSKKLTTIFIVVIVSMITAVSAYSQSAEDIIRRVEENQIHDTVKIEGKMIITDRFGEKVSSFISYARGSEEMLLEFTSKPEAGQKILRTEDEIYLYYPDAEEVIRMQGAALRESVLGSDFSYEDMTGEKSILDSYRASLQGSESIDGHDCYKIELDAKSRDVPYPRQIVWIDKELYVDRKAHKFSLAGELLKEMRIEEIEKIEGKYIPTDIIMEDQLKSDSSTELIIEEIDINIPLDPSLFSLEELTW